jgi:hypothetical protein
MATMDTTRLDAMAKLVNRGATRREALRFLFAGAATAAGAT